MKVQEVILHATVVDEQQHLVTNLDKTAFAVFEDRAIKAQATREAEPFLAPNGIFATNTSTLPITGLAQAGRHPEQYIGLHFFSPVERMPLVEVIKGKHTSSDTLARALDYVRQIGKTAIVVNDSRGFFTSRDGTAVSARGEVMNDLSAPGLRVVLVLEIDKDVRVGPRRPHIVIWPLELH